MATARRSASEQQGGLKAMRKALRRGIGPPWKKGRVCLHSHAGIVLAASASHHPACEHKDAWPPSSVCCRQHRRRTAGGGCERSIACGARRSARSTGQDQPQSAHSQGTQPPSHQATKPLPFLNAGTQPTAPSTLLNHKQQRRLTADCIRHCGTRRALAASCRGCTLWRRPHQLACRSRPSARPR